MHFIAPYNRWSFLTLLVAIIFIPALVIAQQLAVGQQPFAKEGRQVKQQLILIGDIGNNKEDNQGIVTTAVAGKLVNADSNTTVLLLGNNIFPNGLPDEEDDRYDRAAAILKKQLAPFKKTGARIIVIPGNKDWQDSGPDGWEQIKREATFIEGLNWPNLSFFPKGDCPGPEEIPLGDHAVLVIMDSQWWLHPFAKTSTESDCPCKTEDEITARLTDIAYRNRDKQIIFATHHPLRSDGIHGGYYTLRQHIFPLTDALPGAYLPLPLVGSLYPLVRGGFGNLQDLHHPAYRNMTAIIEKALAIAPDVTFVAAHDHNLQLLHDGNRDYIVSGSGSLTDRVKKGKSSLFAAEELGYVTIDILENGERHISFSTIDKNGAPQEAYQYHPVVPAPPRVDPAAFRLQQSPGFSGTEKQMAIAPEYDSVGKLHRRLFGERYRDLWATPVAMKVFYLNQEKGGLTILQRGGGFQTKSLRLKDPTGKEWVLRTLQKDPSKSLTPNLRQTVVRDILQDQISSANPYAPLALPVMEDAIQLPHAHPQIVYVPDDPALGIYKNDFANSACIFEEREPVAADQPEGKTYSSLKLLEKLADDQDNIVDEKAVVRARLFDLLIGDWDRHEDQWRWGKREENGTDVFYPVPRDRDQAFFANTGWLQAIAARKWLQPKFQGFKDYVPNVEGFMFNARYVDRFFMHGLDEKDFVEAARYIQQQLTDAVIEKGVRQMPDTIFAKCGAEIIRKLIARRNILPAEAAKYYRFIAKTVDIPGSDKRDYFEINHHDDGSLEVTATKIKKDGSYGKHPFYHCTFQPGITKEIRIYGRDGKDVFAVTGTTRSSIKVRMIGGQGNDSFYVAPDLHNRSKTLIYDRSDKNNEFPETGSFALRTSDHKDVNDYNGRTFLYNKLMPSATVGYNADDGVAIGLGFRYTTHGFRKLPYAADHQLMVGHALATNATFVKYRGDFKDLIGKNDLNIFLDAHAPDNTSNFFGIGNGTAFLRKRDDNIRYYRARYNVINLQVKLQHALTSKFKIYGGLTGQFYDMDQKDNKDRFISTYQPYLADQDIYSRKFFAGAIAGFELDTRNNKLNTSRGVYWTTSISGAGQLNDDRSYGQATTAVTLYASLRENPNLIVINKAGGGVCFGQPLFYQLLSLGGAQNLRGFRNTRFSGDGLFYHNIEARLKLFDFNSYLFPGSIGLSGFNDVGRVWARGESSAAWHDGYGGGFYIIPAQALLISVLVSHSTENTLSYFTFSYNL